MLASTRERRGNAGAKMAGLLEREDLDDFYKTTYGGFADENNDNVYQSPVQSESDYVDSDFDISESDENDEVAADDAEARPTRKLRVVTKAYKEPVHKRSTDLDRPRPVRKKREAGLTRAELTEKRLRSSTVRQTAECSRRWSDVTPAPRKRYWRHMQYKSLTQEQLLEEAMETEKVNLKSLATYQKWELEQKQKRHKGTKRRVVEGPKIKYISVRMPRTQISTDGDGQQWCGRTFLEFCDGAGTGGSKLLGQFFPRKGERLQPKEEPVCVVTGLAAKYRDPVTLLPYANGEAFKVIRDAYEKHLLKSSSSNPAFVKWRRWREAN